MKLSAEVVTGIKRLCNPNLITNECFNKLAETCINAILQNDSRPPINAIKDIEARPDIVKGAFASLAVVTVEAARNGVDCNTLKTILESYNLPCEKIDAIAEIYGKYKSRIILQLSSIGLHYPQIVGVNWKLDCKLNEASNTYQPLLYVTLFILGHENDKKGNIQFVCTMQHLQELVYVLKGASRYITKMAQ